MTVKIIRNKNTTFGYHRKPLGRTIQQLQGFLPPGSHPGTFCRGYNSILSISEGHFFKHSQFCNVAEPTGISLHCVHIFLTPASESFIISAP